MRLPTWALRILYQQAALRALDEDDQRDHADDHDDDRKDERRRQSTGTAELKGPGKRRGQSGDDAGEDDQRNTVADAAGRDLLTEPHQEHRAAEQRNNGGNPEEPARIVDEAAAAFQTDSDTVGLHRTQQHRAVAGVLVDDLAALLAFFLQLLERRNDRRHELHDDRCGNVRHDAEGEDRHALDRAAREHVEEAEDAPPTVPGMPARMRPG
jgi:hypothetical protein